MNYFLKLLIVLSATSFIASCRKEVDLPFDPKLKNEFFSTFELAGKEVLITVNSQNNTFFSYFNHFEPQKGLYSFKSKVAEFDPFGMPCPDCNIFTIEFLGVFDPTNQNALSYLQQYKDSFDLKSEVVSIESILNIFQGWNTIIPNSEFELFYDDLLIPFPYNIVLKSLDPLKLKLRLKDINTDQTIAEKSQIIDLINPSRFPSLNNSFYGIFGASLDSCQFFLPFISENPEFTLNWIPKSIGPLGKLNINDTFLPSFVGIEIKDKNKKLISNFLIGKKYLNPINSFISLDYSYKNDLMQANGYYNTKIELQKNGKIYNNLLGTQVAGSEFKIQDIDIYSDPFTGETIRTKIKYSCRLFNINDPNDFIDLKNGIAWMPFNLF